MSRVIASGYVSLDRIILVDNEIKTGHTSIVVNHDNSKIYYGGCPVNIAYSLNKLGVESYPILRVGDDYESTGFKGFLEDNHIPTIGIHQVQGVNTSNCYLIEDRVGNHHTIFYPGAMDNKYFTKMNDLCFKDVDLGVITVGPLKDNVEFLEKCKANNIDLVFGAKLDYDAFPISFLEEVLLYSKIIFCNEVEEQELVEKLHINSMSDYLVKGKASVVVVTKGTKGSTCYYVENGSVTSKHIDVVQASKCLDTTGSGDGYIAGFIYGYLNQYSVEDSCKLGSTLASFVVEELGCLTNIPSEKIVLDRFHEVNKNG